MLKAIFLLLLSSLAFAAEEHATISLQRWDNKVVVTIAHDEGWHTYWKNPGDAGIPESFKFFKGTKPVEVKAYEWPAPKRYIESGDIMTIGYSGTKHFYFDNIPDDFNAHIGMLICKDICIPGEAKLTMGKDQEFIASRKADPYSDSELKKAFASLPAESVVPSNMEYYLTRKKGENVLTLHYSIKGVKSSKLHHELPLLTGFPQAPWGLKREKLFFKDGTLYGKTEIEWDGEYQEPVVNLPEDGNFAKAYDLRFLFNDPSDPQVKAITLKIKDFSLASPSLDDFYKGLTPVEKVKATARASIENEKSYFEYLLFAFLGGLILNLMPCVLPVISLKLFGLIKHRNYTQKQLFTHNLSYTLGVIATFMALALVVAGLKAGGEEIGWGFQLQSPGFILAMMLILFILSLNLFGLFEFMTPGGSQLGSKQTEDGFVGDFFSGVLITILSTPCSAPFLGTALTFAFTTTYATIFIMFLFIGLGLAFPFLLTAAFPKTLYIFPRPGAWMEKLKYFLGLTLLATVVWLYDVFVGLVDFDKISWKLNLLFALWFFAFFFAQKISRNRLAQFLVFMLPFSMTGLALTNLDLRPVDSMSVMKKESDWKPWSEAALTAELGKTVFMDFTAEWCLTCKVNKKFVLETDGFKELTEKYKLVLLRADWTRRDDNITQFLRGHNAVGVPAYFIQQPDGKIISLGETISISKIEGYLR
ncbi:MAG TPA: thioredoxin family protein [Bacteriovoracaceae bacterium]|nr:thioredoxin family protein [Bacteriovoracaceae bacterium]